MPSVKNNPQLFEDLYARLEEKRKIATSSLSWRAFHAAVKDYQPSGETCWTVQIETYFGDGMFFAAYYNATLFDPKLTIDDFLVHYDVQVHWAWFRQYAHAEYAVVSVAFGQTAEEKTPILVFKKTGDRFEKFDALLRDAIANESSCE